MSQQSPPNRPSLDQAEQWLRENDPEYLAERQSWKQINGNGRYQPNPAEVPIGDPSDEDSEGGQKSNAELFGRYDSDREFLKREVDRKTDAKPQRKRDRHKVKGDRHKAGQAEYMREYRARKRAEGGDV